MKEKSENTVPRLDDLATDKLTKIGLFHIKIPEDSSPEYQNKAAALIRLIAAKLQGGLLQAVIDGDSNTVKKILTHNPELLAQEPEHLEIQSQLTWQRFKAELPLVMALKRNQVKTVELLLPYFEELEGGIGEALRQWKVAEDGMLAAKKRSERFDFKSLIDVIAQEDFPNGTDITAKLSDETEQAFATFRAAVLPKQAVALSDYYDIEELFKAAFNAYDEYFDIFSGDNEWNQRIVYCVKVMGFIQSLLSRMDAEIWCQGFYDVVVKGQKIGSRAVALKSHEGLPFYRHSVDALSGVGFEYMYGLRGWRLSSRRPDQFDLLLLPLKKLGNYIEQKRQKLEALKKQLIPQCDSASSPKPNRGYG